MNGRLFDLTNRVAVVAGGAGYLGSAVCEGLVRQGATVIVADLDVARAEHLAEGINGMGCGQQNRAVPLDIGREDSIRGLVDRIRSDFTRLDILVNATYCPSRGAPLEAMTGEDFCTPLGANVGGGFLLAREAKRLMSAGGSIVIFSSMYGRVSPDPRIYHKPMEPNPIQYGAAKAAMEQMTRYLAVTWAREGIRVNAIAPGPFPDPQLQQNTPDFIERLAQKVPLGRIGLAGEVVGAVVFLASNAASYVTGQILAVDGGWTVW